MPTIDEIEAYRPLLSRVARHWPGDAEDMVQETIIWACEERSSFNPERGSIEAWLRSMLLTVRHMHIDAWRSSQTTPPVSPRPATRKYDWPPNATRQIIELIGTPAELRALRAKLRGERSSYQGIKLHTLRKRLTQFLSECGDPQAVCRALAGTPWRPVRRSTKG